MTKGYNGSKTPVAARDSWRTPKAVFDYYDRRFGFTCDLAASDENHLCEHYFTAPDENGEGGALNATPDDGCFTFNPGAVFCNPPYSDIRPWVHTCIQMSQAISQAFVMLLPADTSVKWFKTAFENCTECHFISGRLAFISEGTGKPVSGNNKGSVVFVFDPHSPLKSQVTLIDRDEIMGSSHGS